MHMSVCMCPEAARTGRPGVRRRLPSTPRGQARGKTGEHCQIRTTQRTRQHKRNQRAKHEPKQTKPTEQPQHGQEQTPRRITTTSTGGPLPRPASTATPRRSRAGSASSGAGADAALLRGLLGCFRCFWAGSTWTKCSGAIPELPNACMNSTFVCYVYIRYMVYAPMHVCM